MKSVEYRNCAVIFQDTENKYYVSLYYSDGYQYFIEKGNCVVLYKTLKGAEKACKKYGYTDIRYKIANN